MTAGTVRARAAISNGHGGFDIDDIEVDAPGAGEVRVRIVASGLCHTDHQSLTWLGPLVMGHEGAGVIESVGAGVKQLNLGQRVLLNWAMLGFHYYSVLLLGGACLAFGWFILRTQARSASAIDT